MRNVIDIGHNNRRGTRKIAGTSRPGHKKQCVGMLPSDILVVVLTKFLLLN